MNKKIELSQLKRFLEESQLKLDDSESMEEVNEELRKSTDSLYKQLQLTPNQDQPQQTNPQNINAFQEFRKGNQSKVQIHNNKSFIQNLSTILQSSQNGRIIDSLIRNNNQNINKNKVNIPTPTYNTKSSLNFLKHRKAQIINSQHNQFQHCNIQTIKIRSVQESLRISNEELIPRKPSELLSRVNSQIFRQKKNEVIDFSNQIIRPKSLQNSKCYSRSIIDIKDYLNQQQNLKSPKILAHQMQRRANDKKRVTNKIIGQKQNVIYKRLDNLQKILIQLEKKQIQIFKKGQEQNNRNKISDNKKSFLIRQVLRDEIKQLKSDLTKINKNQQVSVKMDNKRMSKICQNQQIKYMHNRSYSEFNRFNEKHYDNTINQLKVVELQNPQNNMMGVQKKSPYKIIFQYSNKKVSKNEIYKQRSRNQMKPVQSSVNNLKNDQNLPISYYLPQPKNIQRVNQHFSNQNIRFSHQKYPHTYVSNTPIQGGSTIRFTNPELYRTNQSQSHFKFHNHESNYNINNLKIQSIRKPLKNNSVFEIKRQKALSLLHNFQVQTINHVNFKKC